jgi:hypothetical protein
VQYPESHRKMASTPWDAMAGRENAGGEGGGSNLETSWQQDRQLLREVALDADRDQSRPSESRDVVAVRTPQDQSPQHSNATLMYFAMCQRRNVAQRAVRIDGTDGS